MTTYTDKFVMAEVMVPNVRQDSIHVTIENHSDVPIGKTTDIDHISYEQATKSVHGNNNMSQEAEHKESDQPGPSGEPSGIRPQRVPVFSEPSLDECITPPKTPAKILVE